VSPPPFPFDAVLFDMDGTLVATDRFWLPAATAGARRAFAELELDRDPPTKADWLSMVGLPLDEGFARICGDLAPRELALLKARVLEEEEEAVAGNGIDLLPGVRAALGELRRLGVRTGIASNCEARYLERVMGAVGLPELIDEARCLDSEGVQDKADMVCELLRCLGTRSAVMVGDRVGDRDAAHANGLPHVHLAGGFAPPGEEVSCEAVIEGAGGLLDRLRGRTRWIEGALEQLGVRLEGPPGGPRTIGITGGAAAGKTLFTRDAARILRARGRPATAVGAEAFRRGEARSEPGRLLLVEGPDLLEAELRPRLDRVLLLEVSREVARRRLGGRRRGRAGPAAPEPEPPRGSVGGADLCLRADNALGLPG